MARWRFFVPSLVILSFSLTFLPLRAQGLRRPLTFVPADSVRVWGYHGEDFCTLGRRAFAGARPLTLSFSGECGRRKRGKLLREWGRIVAARPATPAGSPESPFGEAQARAAVPLFTAAARLLLLTGDAAYADAMERTLHNAAAQSATRATASAAPETDTAETRAAAALLATLPAALYAREGADVYVNLYANSTARLSSGGKSFTLDQITSMPFDGAVKLRLTRFRGPLRLRLHLRLPDWAVGRAPAGGAFAYAGLPKKRPRVFLCGHEVEVPTRLEGGYLVVEKEWEEMDEVYLSFPLEPLLLRPAGAGDNPLRSPAALQRGPLVYAFPQEVAGCYLPPSSPPEVDGDDGVTLRGTAYSKENAPQDASVRAVPYSAIPYFLSRGGLLWVE